VLTEDGVRAAPPRPLPAEPAASPLPDSLGYRLKSRILGRPLHTEDLEQERLGKPTALAVFASDNLSSSAYATEEILRVLVPVVGLGAFALVVPVTTALLVVLFFLILSYRQTIKAYPTAGGAYMVTRDNFGLLPAQVAGVALLIDYVLTVAVSVAAGSAALASAFPALAPWVLPLSVGFVAVLAYGNLRGVRESGKVFAAPTYFFIANMAILLGVGLSRMASGTLEHASRAPGMVDFGPSGDGLLMGAGLAVVLHSFASGGAAVTGVEAISNGVPAFREPAWRNARTTLVVMGALLGAMFLGLSALVAQLHVAPFESGTPTVISQVGELVYGPGPLGRLLYFALQAGTMLILVLAANTSFADFPRLASFHAGDRFMPRQLTKRGHRLVFSNGIIFLSVAAIVLLVVTGAKVEHLIPLYAIGVFTSFTFSQAGMARHHLREREPGWRWGLFVNGTGALMCLVVDLVIARYKFAEGAWVIVLLVPVMVAVLVRLARQYEREALALEHHVPEAISARLRGRLVVLVFVDSLDVAAAQAMQFGRTLRPDELRAVHFVTDRDHARRLAGAWQEHGLQSLDLELVDCPDRRLARAAVSTVAQVLRTGDTEVCVVLPERMYNGAWHRLLHDQTAERLAREISRLPHANVTTVPFHFDRDREGVNPVATPTENVRRPRAIDGDPREPGSPTTPEDGDLISVGDVVWRRRARVAGRIQSLRVSRPSGSPTLECTLTDGTGAISVVFLGRRHIDGLDIGATVEVQGMAIERHGRLAIVNPTYELSS
jgi:amino acid transporter